MRIPAFTISAIFSSFEYSYHITINRSFFKQYFVASLVSIFLALLLLAFGVYGSLYKKMENKYVKKIRKLRAHYNHYIKYYEDSPLEQDEISYFDALDYFAIDENYKIKDE
mgnify:CR=1 FL=1